MVPVRCVDGAESQAQAMNWLHWSLLSAFFAGLTAVLAKVGVTGVDSNLATAVRTTVVLGFAWLVVLLTGVGGEVAGFSRRTWMFLVASGIATGLSWLCYFRALQLGEASRVAPVDKLSVVFVLVVAALFLREPVTLKTGIGALLITAGSVVLAVK
jgi:transporter family protein